MPLLNLTFLNNPMPLGDHPIEKILHKYGQGLYDYTKGVFNYIVTTGGFEGETTTFSLYILVPEIGYDYQILNLKIKDVNTIELFYFTLKTQQTEIEAITVDVMRNDFAAVDPVVKKHLESPLSDATYRFLINQVLTKRETRSEKFDGLE
jgi:hypothetical protein